MLAWRRPRALPPPPPPPPQSLSAFEAASEAVAVALVPAVASLCATPAPHNRQYVVQSIDRSREGASGVMRRRSVAQRARLGLAASSVTYEGAASYDE